jgi:hypothetical protein
MDTALQLLKPILDEDYQRSHARRPANELLASAKAIELE